MEGNNVELKEELPADMSKLLNEFQQVFTEPTGLPPQQNRDHGIPLRPNHSSVNMHPQWYAYYQKFEIERMVKEMSKTRLIRPSSSPFSSPFLLVKKSYGTWELCVDFKALSIITIKNKHPIPAIDELLDELYGAQYFLKLDLRAGYHQIWMKEEDIHKATF